MLLRHKRKTSELNFELKSKKIRKENVKTLKQHRKSLRMVNNAAFYVRQFLKHNEYSFFLTFILKISDPFYISFCLFTIHSTVLLHYSRRSMFAPNCSSPVISNEDTAFGLVYIYICVQLFAHLRSCHSK